MAFLCEQVKETSSRKNDCDPGGISTGYDMMRIYFPVNEKYISSMDDMKEIREGGI
jgi:hypothetical protein